MSSFTNRARFNPSLDELPVFRTEAPALCAQRAAFARFTRTIEQSARARDNTSSGHGAHLFKALDVLGQRGHPREDRA